MDDTIKMQGIIKDYSITDLLEAQAAFLAAFARHPEKLLGPEYFLGILRHTREEKAKRIYNEEFRAGLTLPELRFNSLSELELAKEITLAISDAMKEAATTKKLLILDSIAWNFMGFHGQIDLKQLWLKVEKEAERLRSLSYRNWQTASSYLFELIGGFTHPANSALSEPYRRCSHTGDFTSESPEIYVWKSS